MSQHINPTPPDCLGQRLIFEVSKLTSVQCPDSPNSACLVVWSSSAIDQLEACVAQWLKEQEPKEKDPQ